MQSGLNIEEPRFKFDDLCLIFHVILKPREACHIFLRTLTLLGALFFILANSHVTLGLQLINERRVMLSHF